MIEERRRVLENDFNNDMEAYQKFLDEQKRKVISWNDLVVAASTYPEHEHYCRRAIAGLYGYLPAEHLIIPQEPFIRAALHQNLSGHITFDEMIDQVEECLKPIRNEEVRLLSSGNLGKYSEEIFKKYHDNLQEARLPVRDRLVRLLGYAPDLEHSAAAEILLRIYFLNDRHHFPEEPVGADFEAIHLIKYREAYFSKGKEAADKSRIETCWIKALYERNTR